MSLIEIIEELIANGEKLAPQGGNMIDGYNGKRQPDYVAWRLQSIAAIEELGSEAKLLLKDIENDDSSPYFYVSSADNLVGTLKAALAIAKRKNMPRTQDQDQTKTKGGSREKVENRVFVVHGHHEALLHQTARFLNQIGVETVILFEQAGKGQTIIEKLESNSSVSFAVVLLTPDDLGKAAKDEGDLHPRARQNVILELGFFLGKLNRSNVAVLHDESVELPSDYHGVEYIRIDPSGAWKLKLAKEMKEAGLDIDMNKAI